MSATDVAFPSSEVEKTEARMLELLRVRYTHSAGNGDAWAFVPHVRDAAGFNATRTADAIAMALWPSRGLVLHGFEIKVSRSDWLRELKKPEKAERFCEIVDFWWVVAADKTIVQPGELPDTWGLLVAKGSRLVAEKEAPRLKDETAQPVDRGFVACLLRSAAKVQRAGPAEIAEALAAERERIADIHEERVRLERERYDQLLGDVQAFQQAAGIKIGDSRYGTRSPAAVGRAVRAVLDGEKVAERLEQRLDSLRRQALEIAEAAERADA